MAAEVDVIIVDDHPMMLEGLRAGLDEQPGVNVIGTATGVEDYRERQFARWGTERVTVALVDFSLPDGTGLDIAQMNRDGDSTIPTILISGHQRQGLLRDAMSAGCQGLLSKTITIKHLVEAIGTVASGSTLYPASELMAALSGDLTETGATLTHREREVLGLLAEALSADGIADHLALSVNTVRSHIRSILSKLHVNSQLEAVVVAQRSGLV